MNVWMKTFAVGAAAAVACLTGPLSGTAAQAANWQDTGGECHNGGISGISKYLWCWDKKKRLNDGNATTDVFAFHMSLSGEVTSGWLNRLWVEMDPRPTSPTMAWYSTDPRKPNQSYTTPTNCKNWTWSIGASSGVSAAYGESGTICSSSVAYEPVNSSEPGHHAGDLWNGDCWPEGTTKRVTAAVLVKVAQGKVPLWDTSKHGVHKRRAPSQCEDY